LRVAERLAAEKGPDATVLINLSGRGDKDMGTAIEWFGLGDPDQVTEEPVGEPDTAARTDDATPVHGTGSGEGREQL
jgi:tryptophan synthase beta chain